MLTRFCLFFIITLLSLCAKASISPEDLLTSKDPQSVYSTLISQISWDKKKPYVELAFDTDQGPNITVQVLFIINNTWYVYSHSYRSLGKSVKDQPFALSKTIHLDDTTVLNVRFWGLLKPVGDPNQISAVWQGINSKKRFSKKKISANNMEGKDVNSLKTVNNVVGTMRYDHDLNLNHAPESFRVFELNTNHAEARISRRDGLDQIVRYQKNKDGVWQAPIIKMP